MPEETIRSSGIRKNRFALQYQSDLGFYSLIRIDVIIEDSQGSIITPITPSYQSQFITPANPSALPKRQFNPRECDCCFNNNNTNEIHRTIYNPYAPTNNQFLILIQELLGYNGVESVSYTGESKSDKVEDLI